MIKEGDEEVTVDIEKMGRSFSGRDLLDFSSYSGSEIGTLLVIAAELKAERARGIRRPLLAGMTLAMIFDKASTRTRVSFEVGMFELGGHALFLSGSDTQLGRGEPIPDTARVLSRYVDGIMIRTFAHQSVVELAQYAQVPVINGLTDLHHPCQVLADLLTIQEKLGRLAGVKIAYIGDGNNMAHSLLQAAALMKMDIRIATPAGYGPDSAVLEEAKGYAQAAQTQVLWTQDPFEAVADADVIYTDVWTSMGQESEFSDRVMAFKGYQVNTALLAAAAPQAIFLHCLPAHRGEEVAAEVIDGPQSVVFDQAENRLHVQKAVLLATMGNAKAIID